MKNSFRITLFLLLITVSFDSYSQGKVEKSKEEVKEGSKNGDTEKRESSSTSQPTESEYSFKNIIVNGVVQVFLHLTYYAAVGNYLHEKYLYNPLTYYPYDSNSVGNYQNVDSISSPVKHFRIDLDNKLLFTDESIFGNHLKAKIRPFQYFYLQGDYFQLIEYNTIRNIYSNLSLFNINVCYDRFRLEKFNLGWTLGLNYIGNDVNKAGFTYGFNTDIFLNNHLSLYSSIKWSLINSVAVNEFELQGKYHIKNYFFTVGYEYLKIATPTYNFISLGAGIYL